MPVCRAAYSTAYYAIQDALASARRSRATASNTAGPIGSSTRGAIDAVDGIECVPCAVDLVPGQCASFPSELRRTEPFDALAVVVREPE